MELAVRSYLTAGVALAGAGVIAVSPVMPTSTDIQLPAVSASSAAVTLSALTNPVDAWAQTLSTASTNLQALGEQLLASDFPILRTVISNQIGNATVVGNTLQAYADNLTTTLQGLPDALQTASDLISQGEITAAVDGLTLSLLPAILGLLDVTNNTWSGVSTTAQNFVNVIKQVPNVVTAVALPAAFPLLSVVNGLAATAEEVVKAANAGDTEGAVSAIVNAPATLTDAFLNGKGTILGFIPVPGLLSPSSPLGALGSGPIASLLDLPKTIAEALDPNPLAPVASSATATSAKLSSPSVNALSSGTSARSVTLSVPAAETDSAKASDDVAAESSGAATGSDADTATGTTAAAISQDDSATSTATKAAPSTKTATKAAIKKPGATASPATKIRDNMKKAAQRFAGKAGKSSSTAGSSDSSASSAAKSSHKRGGDHDK
ncbi:hypothetical protein VST63_18550 [Mycolicibacterium sp. 050232]|uniref:hypothetical protein n=1 Tax=Mycolicibacterium sp. 050232 TaxID=3113982 RepID=UPI002E294E22|nr:hypothetical protein [Mycolicibacterium sp. 050232]MED5814367.1 hypothetical protein [Mycolicibacterium sp. 050232]